MATKMPSLVNSFNIVVGDFKLESIQSELSEAEYMLIVLFSPIFLNGGDQSQLSGTIYKS